MRLKVFLFALLLISCNKVVPEEVEYTYCADLINTTWSDDTNSIVFLDNEVILHLLDLRWKNLKVPYIYNKGIVTFPELNSPIDSLKSMTLSIKGNVMDSTLFVVATEKVYHWENLNLYSESNDRQYKLYLK